MHPHNTSLKPVGLAIVAVLIILGAARSLRADLSWQALTRTTITVNGQESVLNETSEQYYLKQNVTRVDNVNEGVTRFFNFQSRMLVIVNFQAKLFAVLPMQEVINQINQNRQATQQDLINRERMLDNLDPQARPLMAAQIQAQREKYRLWNQVYKVTPTEERSEVNGHPCRKYVGSSGEEPFQEIWVAEDIAIDDAYRNFFARGLSTFDRQEYGHLPQTDGFPLRVVSRYGPVTVTINYTAVSTETIPAEAFILPSDLRPSPNVVRGP